MAINCEHLRYEIVRPTLERIRLFSPEAEELILGTIAQESHMGEFLKQLEGGPALGICQMEPATHDDIYANFLRYRPQLRTDLLGLASDYAGVTAYEMVGNLRYSVAMCRVHYFRVPKALPKLGDVYGQAAYWKRWYNTSLGKGTKKEFIENYRRFVA